MSHTPGPWSATKHDESCGYWHVDSPGTAMGGVATCYSTASGSTEANARLIAAAPDLLAALVAMLATQEQTKPAIPKVAAMSMARAAIAKAEGK